MRLEKTSRALDQATRTLAELEESVDDSDRFREKFVSCIGMIQRVGAILDEESRGHRSPGFGAFWKETGNDPLFRFMSAVRNAEFKRGEDRKTAHHQVGVFETATMRASLNIKKIVEGRVVEDVTYSDPPVETMPSAESTHTITWKFAGGAYDGDEVLPLLRRYLSWLSHTIIPEAEDLTTE